MGVVLINTNATSNSNTAQVNKLKVQQILTTSPDNIQSGYVSLQYVDAELPEDQYISNLVFNTDFSKYLNEFKEVAGSNSYVIKITNLTKETTLLGTVTNIANNEVKITIATDDEKSFLRQEIDVDDELIVELDFASKDVTPLAINGLQVQDEQENALGTITEKVKLKNLTFNNTTKTLEAYNKTANAVFVSSEGDDVKAEAENPTRPYQTLDAAIAAYKANTSFTRIIILTSTAFSVNNTWNASGNRTLYIESEEICTINWNATAWITNYAKIEINTPKGTINNNASTGGNSSNRPDMKINCDVFNQNSGAFGYMVNDGVQIECNILNATAGLFTGYNYSTKNKIIVKDVFNISSSSGTFKVINQGIRYTADIATINNTGNTDFYLDSSVIDVGSITGTGSFRFYLRGSGTSKINYKFGSAITVTNFSHSAFNSYETLQLSGYLNAPNHNIMDGQNSTNPYSLSLIDANVKCNALGAGRFRGGILLDNSNVEVATKLFHIYDLGASTFELPDPILTIKGACYITRTDNAYDFDLITKSISIVVSNPTIDVDITKGILYTKGKFNRALLNIIESPFNRYSEISFKNQVVVRDKYQIINKTLDVTKSYVIDGELTLTTGQYIEVPDTGNLTINGYGLESSKITKAVAGESIFKKSATNSAGLQLQGLKLDGGGVGTCFDLEDSTGNNALEFNVVNLENFASLGTLNGYRQFLGTTLGIYGCGSGFILDGTWSGFKITNTNVFGFGASGKLFEAGPTLLFNSRFYAELNTSLPAGAIISDFSIGNFNSNKLFQLKNGQYTLNGSNDAVVNTPLLLPNISEKEDAAFFEGNQGISNSFAPFSRIKGEDGLFYEVYIDATGTLTARTV